MILDSFYNNSADFIDRKYKYFYIKEDTLKNPEAIKLFGGYSY
jgi:hypothetical protein